MYERVTKIASRICTVLFIDKRLKNNWIFCMQNASTVQHVQSPPLGCEHVFNGDTENRSKFIFTFFTVTVHVPSGHILRLYVTTTTLLSFSVLHWLGSDPFTVTVWTVLPYFSLYSVRTEQNVLAVCYCYVTTFCYFNYRISIIFFCHTQTLSNLVHSLTRFKNTVSTKWILLTLFF